MRVFGQQEIVEALAAARLRRRPPAPQRPGPVRRRQARRIGWPMKAAGARRLAAVPSSRGRRSTSTSPSDVLIDAGRTWDRRRILKQTRGSRAVAAGADPRPPRPPGGREGRSARSAGSRSPATPTTSTRWRAGGRSRRRAADNPVNRLIASALAGPAAQGRPGAAARATRWPAFASSTPPATPAAR